MKGIFNDIPYNRGLSGCISMSELLMGLIEDTEEVSLFSAVVRLFFAAAGLFFQPHIVVNTMERMSEYKRYKKDICAITELDFGKRQKHEEILEEIEKLESLRFMREIK